MATVTTPPPKILNRSDADLRVRHPLQKLRGYIRTYVTLEGAAVALLFLALWFWIGLALDYGAFRLFAFDWTYELNEATGGGTANVLRVAILVVLVGALLALVVTKILLRLLREFRDTALALVLQRRFPRELGDRLITAVEMADPKIAERYGFSQGMIDQTIREAAERVETLPVGGVFNWGRLIWLGVFVLACTLIVYLVTLTAVCAAEGQPVGHYFIRFNHTAAIWAERNLLLMDTYWPRNAHLEFVRLQANRDGEVRVSRDYTAEEPRPDVIVRSIRYVIADRDAPIGWRALKYKDLQDSNLVDASVLAVDLPRDWGHWYFDLDDLPARVPNGMIPAEWNWQGKTSSQIRAELSMPEVRALLDSPRGRDVQLREAIDELLDWHTWTLDKIELQVDHKTVKRALIDRHEPQYRAFKALFDAVSTTAADPGMERTLRELEPPSEVTAIARGKQNKLTKGLARKEFNKYTLNLNALKESSRLSFNAEDFYTPGKQITLLAPPDLDLIVADKEEPAYLYYRLVGKEEQLAGQRQILRGVPVSRGGTESTINLASGSNVVIRGTAARDLRDSVKIVQDEKPEGAVLAVLPKVRLLDSRTFEARLNDVTQKTEIDFVFRDVDGVKGKRRFILLPVDDSPALVTDVALPPRLRHDPKSPNRRLITAKASFPWKGKLSDDRCLTSAAWIYEYEEREIETPKSKVASVEPEAKDPGKDKEPQKLTDVEKVKEAVGRVGRIFLRTPPAPPGYAFNELAWLANMTYRRAVIKGKGIQEMPTFKRIYTEKYADDVTAGELALLLQVHPDHRLLLDRLLAANISADQLRDVAGRYHEVSDDAEKLTALKAKLAPAQIVIQTVFDDVKKGSLDNLQTAEKFRAFTRDVLAVSSVAKGQRDELEKRLRKEPLPVLADLLIRLDGKTDEKAQLSKALGKRPQFVLDKFKQHDLENEPPFNVAQFGLKVEKEELHYELKLSIRAKDSNVEPGARGTPDAGPFTFLIISETELYDLMLLKKSEMRRSLKEVVDRLEDRRVNLDSEAAALKEGSRPDVAATLARLDQAIAHVREAGDVARGVLAGCEGILEEMEINNFTDKRQTDEKEKIIFPLRSVCNQRLTRDDLGALLDEQLTGKLSERPGGEAAKTGIVLTDFRDALQAALKKVGKDEGDLWDKEIGKNLPLYRQRAELASARVNDLSKKLTAVLTAMKDLEDDRALIQALRQIVESQREATPAVDRARRQREEEILKILEGK